MNKPKISWSETITHESSRQHFQFLCVFAIMAFISVFMTVMNYFTGWRDALMHATLYFSIANIVNVLIEFFGKNRTRQIPRILFAIEIVFLFTFFIINGQPKGFSSLWALLMPSCGLLLYQGVVGSLISGVQLAIIIFLFYFPDGRQLLNYEYTDVFMMRFPVLYTAFFGVGLFFELVLHYNQQALSAARDKFQSLYADEEVRANREQDTNYRIMHVLADEYRVVLSVDMESGEISLYSGQSYVNPSLHGLSFDDAMTLYRNNWVSPEYKKTFEHFFSRENIMKSLEYDNSTLLTYSTLTKGEEHYLQAKIIKIPDLSGAVKKIIVTFADTDNYVREQQQIQQELRTQRLKADTANKAKTNFLFNMSHDIRTPMNAILGFTNMAIRDLDNPKNVRENLQKVRLSGDMLLSLINDILDMSRIESGKVTLNETKVDLGKVFENIQSVMASLAASKDIDLSFDVSEIKDRFVFADITRVDRILVNLISNAIKYTEGEGRVEVSCRQLGSDKPGYCTYKFTVKDNGIGMSEEFQKRMFEEFAREENSSLKAVQGTGLGLPLAKKLSELMGGGISCESKQGVGSTFNITLPFRLQTEEEIQEQSQESRTQIDADFKGKSVLLVEDNELNREIASYILEENGMLVEPAENGKDAVRLVSEKGPDYYDFVLMDIHMPIMDGYEAAEEIRRLYPDSKLPIIALSANAFEEDRQKSIAAGMNDHVSKPINIDDLLKTLSKYV